MNFPIIDVYTHHHYGDSVRYENYAELQEVAENLEARVARLEEALKEIVEEYEHPTGCVIDGAEMGQIARRDGVGEAHGTDENLSSLLPGKGVSVCTRSRFGGVQMSVKRYDFDCYAFYDSARLNVQECDDGDYVLHSDYAALLTRHNALRDAVAWERECLDTWEYVPALKMQALAEQVASMNGAGAEVDRLLKEL